MISANQIEVMLSGLRAENNKLAQQRFDAQTALARLQEQKEVIESQMTIHGATIRDAERNQLSIESQIHALEVARDTKAEAEAAAAAPPADAPANAPAPAPAETSGSAGAVENATPVLD